MKCRGQESNARKNAAGREVYKPMTCKEKEGGIFLVMDKELNEILEYYGANLDDSGEPDEAPESEGAVTLPTPEEEKQLKQDWDSKVKDWNKAGGEKQ